MSDSGGLDRPAETGQWSEAALRVLKERYLAEGETPEDMCWRVARKIASAEAAWGADETAIREIADRFYELMVRREFLPNSPTLMNAGRNDTLQFSACFVLPVEDSIKSIYGTMANAAIIHQTGGGTGFAFSRLRPKGSPCRRSGGTASGPVSFLKAYDAATEAVKQGGRRRGANMCVLRVDHPDILDFIDCKLDGGIRNFNISVAVTDVFMRALTDGTAYELVNPQTGLSAKMLLARDVWEAIVQAAWRTGDPGLLFLDRINHSNANPIPLLETIEATNPCFRGDVKVWTIHGPKRFDELVGRAVPILTELADGTMAFRAMRKIRQTRKSAQVYEVVVKPWKGRRSRQKMVGLTGSFVATGDHKVYLLDGSLAEVSSLRPGDRLASVYRTKANQHYSQLRNRAEADMEHRIVASYAYGRRPEYPVEHVDHIDGDKRNNLPGNLEVLPGYEHDALKMRGANNPMVRFPEKNRFRLGFHGAENGMFGRQHSEETKRKIGAKTVERFRDPAFRERVRLGQERAIAEGRWVNHEVVSVTLVESAPVYCGSVEETGRFFIVTEDGGGVLVKNCGEQPLGPNDVCNLGSINLARFVNPDSVDSTLLFDWKRLGNVVRLAVRFLDNVIEVNPYPLPEIAETAKANRRVGLGVMGWADLLMELGIPYDSEEALSLADKLMHQIGEAARIASIDLAKARGPFPRWVQSIYKNEHCPIRNATRTTIAPTGSISILADCSSGIEPAFALAYQHRVKQADGERVLDFFNPTVRRTLEELQAWSPNVQQAILKTGTFPKGGFTFPSGAQATYVDLEGVFKTAHEIAPEWHVKHQAAFQRYTDNGVSKTINLPASATPEDVSKAYLLAWELGCLGITVFRDGCKGGEQVLHVGRKEELIVPKTVAVRVVEEAVRDRAVERAAELGSGCHEYEHRSDNLNCICLGEEHAGPKTEEEIKATFDRLVGKGVYEVFSPATKVKPRPKVVTGKTYRMVTPLGAAFVTVNENGTGEPFEVFVNVGKAGSDTAAVSEALGRLLSLALRMPSPMSVKERVEQIVKQLGGIGGRNPVGFGKAKVRSLPDAIAKTLMYHTGLPGTLMNRERETDLRQAIGDLCPDCGVGGLVYEEGCVKCYGCGYSEC